MNFFLYVNNIFWEVFDYRSHSPVSHGSCVVFTFHQASLNSSCGLHSKHYATVQLCNMQKF